MNSISGAIAMSGFKTIDFVILAFYLILLVGLGLFLSRNKDGKEKSANDYFMSEVKTIAKQLHTSFYT